MFILLVIPELDLHLESTELYGGLQGHGVGPVQDGLLGLLVQQVKLDRVSDKIKQTIKKTFS